MIRVVLLHGFLGAPAAWDAVRSRLLRAAPHLVVSAPPLPGHGLGAAPIEPRPFLDEVAAFADSLGDAPAVWVGYSMGGRLALGVAAARPGRVLGLVLVSAHPGLTSADERRHRAADDDRFARLAEEQGIDALATAHASRSVLLSQSALPAAQVATLHARRRAHDPVAIATSIRALGLGAMPDCRPALAALRAPVATVAGGQDRAYAAHARQLADLASGEVSVVERVGHDVVLEAPDEVADAVLRTIGRVERETRGLGRVTETRA